MGLLVKICGVNTAAAADAVVRSGADFAGLVFHPKSPRNLSFEAARSLASQMRGRVQLVVLVADADDGLIAGAMEAVKPDFLQLHGRETPERVAALKSRHDVKVIKALAVATAADLAAAGAYTQISDMFLFDAKAPEGHRPGGHGVAFDWQILRGKTFARPWLLAGGLAPDNVARAIAAAEAQGVDVSSGVETEPGVKSAEKIAAFMAAAKNKEAHS